MNEKEQSEIILSWFAGNKMPRMLYIKIYLSKVCILKKPWISIAVCNENITPSFKEKYRIEESHKRIMRLICEKKLKPVDSNCISCKKRLLQKSIYKVHTYKFCFFQKCFRFETTGLF